MWFAPHFCWAAYSRAEACCPVQGYEEEIYSPFFFFSSQIQTSHFQNHLYSCVFPLSLPVGPLFGPALFYCFLFFLYSAARYTLHGWAQYNSPEVRPAIFPHPSDAGADSMCPRGNVVFLAGGECPGSVAVRLLELSQPTAPSHQQALVQAAAGSEMGNLREEHTQQSCPASSSTLLLLFRFYLPACALWHLTFKCH